MVLRPMVAIVALCCAGAAATGCRTIPSPLAPAVQGSVGLPHRGVLTHARSLPQQGPGYRRLRADRIRWGIGRLVTAIEQAARAVQRQRPGPPLLVADLSAQRGGKIPRHRSHRTGRDVDFLFYVTTPDGRPVRNPGFLHFGPDGLAPSKRGRTTFYRLDLERQWLLIRALVSSPEANVQWLFVARWLEALIIEYARARGEDPELIWRALVVLHQPSNSSSHDDHIHMRLACMPDEMVAGCSGGPRWPWLPRIKPVTWSDEELLEALMGEG